MDWLFLWTGLGLLVVYAIAKTSYQLGVHNEYQRTLWRDRLNRELGPELRRRLSENETGTSCSYPDTRIEVDDR